MGCQKASFLEQQNTQQLTAQTLFKTSADAIKLVNGIYDTFHDRDFLIKALWYQANFLTQDFKNWGSDVFFATYEVPTNFGALETFWNRSYAGIARANSAIPIIAKMKADGILTAELADRLTGEATFLRGIFYYYLASNFGGVPLELELPKDDGRHPRNTQDEVFARVVADMGTAAKLLPWKQELAAIDIGRASKGAALAYMGDAQMWLKKYAEAVTTYEQIKGHSFLEEKFLDIHSYNNQNGKESIFELQYIEQADMRNSNNDTHWLTTFCLPQEISNTGYAYADPKLHASFEPNDQRRVATVIGPGEEHPDPLIKIRGYTNVILSYGAMNTLGTVDKPWKGSDGLRSGYYGVKTWRDPYVSGNRPIAPGSPTVYYNSGQNIPIMRYGQVLLSKAEAMAKSGQAQAARDVINNEIRSRAGLGAAPQNKDLTQIIIDEYRHELNDEFSLWFLLRRSGEHLKFVQQNYGIAVPPGKDLMPIPQNAIAINSKLVQNPGY
jgi:hypothetical protein